MQQCAISDKPIVYQVKDTGLWGEPIRRREPVITNDYAAPNPHKKGTPPGHVRLTRHMSIPVFDGGRIVAVAGVGNKSEDYHDDDVKQLTLFMDGMWRILCRKRSGRGSGRQHPSAFRAGKRQHLQRDDRPGAAGGNADDRRCPGNRHSAVGGEGSRRGHDRPLRPNPPG